MSSGLSPGITPLQGQRSALLTAAGLFALLLWTLHYTRPYLNLDPAVVPVGAEYSSTISLHHLWTWARVCGWCALWNGSMGGGLPALADPYGSTLHPLVALTALGWGVPNGAKLALVGSFLMAGLGQWWLGRVLGLGPVACLWSGAMAVVAGNLASRMQAGAFAVIVSTAACSLVLAPLIAVSLRGTRRWAVVLGVVLALAAVSGQGYMQIGLIGALPAVLLLLPWGSPRLWPVVRHYALAAVLGALLAAPFLLPVLRASPLFEKQSDPQFQAAQPFQYIPFNLLIDDVAFFASPVLGKTPAAPDNVNFVGWLPVLLAILALVPSLWKDDDRSALRQVCWFLAAFALLTMWLGSATPFIWINQRWPGSPLAQQVAGIRYATYITGLTVPCVLALAAVTVDRLLRRRWPRLWLAIDSPAGSTSGEGRFRLDTRWLLAVPLVWALLQAATFGGQWIRTQRTGPELRAHLAALQTPDTQWVATVFGEQHWIEPATEMGLKFVPAPRTNIQRYTWKGRQLPAPVLEAARSGAPEGMTLRNTAEGIGVYAAPPGREYAAVQGEGGQRTVCAARAIAGQVDVDCPAGPGGVLTVQENSAAGWEAHVDGRPVRLGPGQWLTMPLDPGPHRVSLRYRPRDVTLGLLLGAGGLALAAYAWRRDARPDAPPRMP